jgi:hypothetical protein
LRLCICDRDGIIKPHAKLKNSNLPSELSPACGTFLPGASFSSYEVVFGSRGLSS